MNLDKPATRASHSAPPVARRAALSVRLHSLLSWNTRLARTSASVNTCHHACILKTMSRRVLWNVKESLQETGDYNMDDKVNACNLLHWMYKTLTQGGVNLILHSLDSCHSL